MNKVSNYIFYLPAIIFGIVFTFLFYYLRISNQFLEKEIITSIMYTTEGIDIKMDSKLTVKELRSFLTNAYLCNANFNVEKIEDAFFLHIMFYEKNRSEMFLEFQIKGNELVLKDILNYDKYTEIMGCIDNHN